MRDPVYLALLPLCLFISTIDAQNLAILGENPLKAKLQNNVFVSCVVQNAADNETPGIKWYNPIGEEITSTTARVRIRSNNEKLILVIASLTKDDAGTYRCEATVNGVLTSEELHLTTYKGLVITDANPNQRPTAGEDSTIVCIVEAGEGEMSLWWTRGNGTDMVEIKPAGRYAYLPRGLRIRNISRSDNGVYVCNIASDSNLQMIRINVLVKIKPTMVHPPVLTKAIQGEQFQMECRATGEPSPHYKWFKSGMANALEPPRYQVDRVIGKLVIEEVHIQDAGTYKCRAKNDAGAVEAEAELKVMVPPQITQLQNRTGKAGSSQTLTCIATGDPAPSMTWRKQTENTHFPVTSEGRYVVAEVKEETKKRTQVTLTINQMEASDTGVYICRAENDAGSVTKAGKMTVHFKSTFDNTPLATVYNWAGHFGNITCVADGDPVPGITWYKGVGGPKSEITEATVNYRISVSQAERQATSNLTVRVDFGNQETIYGKYTCRATNSEGPADHVITMVEAKKPEPPLAAVAIKTPRTVQFLVTEPPVQGPEVTKYIIEFTIKGKPLSKETLSVSKERTPDADSQAARRTRVIINNLDANTDYIFDVFAENAVGRSEPHHFTHTTPVVRWPYRVNSFTSHWEGAFSHMYKLTWKPPNDGGSTITGYNLRYHEIQVRRPNSTHTGQQWEVAKILGSWKTKNNIKGNLLQYQMTNLDPNTFYEIEFRAINPIGEGELSSFIFKTKAGEKIGEVGDEKITASSPVPPSKTQTAQVDVSGQMVGSGMPLYSSKTNVAVILVALLVIACMPAFLRG